LKTLVLGGSGFLGSHVADQLILAGHDVRVFDRISSQWLHPDQQMIVGDILDQATLDQAIDGCEVVYNFAAIADLDEALSKPLETARINVLGNVQVLEACRKAEVQRYIYASTGLCLQS
jgi:Nucleoside-diphosphate-sugar epimerases